MQCSNARQNALYRCLFHRHWRHVCRGCKRFAHEVIDWNSYTPEQKAVVDARLSGFLSQCVSNKLQVTDKALLQWQLQVQQMSLCRTTMSTAGFTACSRQGPARSTYRGLRL